MKSLIKIFASLLVVLIVASVLIVISFEKFPTSNTLVTTQDKAMAFMENVLLFDLSKYTVDLKVDSARDSSTRLFNDNRKIHELAYELKSEDNNSQICFTFENTILRSYIGPLGERVITSKQYTNQRDAIAGFLERYQPYTKIDSKKFMSMLNNVDLTKNSTTTLENTKLVVTTSTFWGNRDVQITLRWTHTVNGADYNVLMLEVNTDGSISNMIDTWALYTIGDTSINISREQAIDIAIENIDMYTYEWYNDEVVGDFKVHRDNAVTTLLTAPYDDYELRPYWKVELLLDKVYPGNVFGITIFIWAGTGEIHSYGNMATGLTNDRR